MWIFLSLKPYDQSPIDSILRLLHDVVIDFEQLHKPVLSLDIISVPRIGATQRTNEPYYEKTTILHRCVDRTSGRFS